MDRSGKDAELLLAHSEWVRRLARSLVSDRDSADDLVQRTWVAALERPPGDEIPLRAWFAGVLRNLARQDRRAADRRTAREHAAARKDVLPAADESLEAILRQKLLMQAVLDLDEPYRSVIVRRYFDEKPPREIAEELGIPVKTVKTRLSRALEKLRERLDREHGSDRAAWMALFAPLVHMHGPAAGGLLMDAKLKAAIAVAVAAGTIAAVVHFSSPANDVASSPLANAPAVAPLEAEDAPKMTLVDEASGVAVERAAASTPAPAKEAAPAPVKAEERVRGRVIDLSGASVANVDVYGSNSVPAAFREKPALARTDSSGAFEFVKHGSVFQLAAESDVWTTAYHPRLDAHDPEHSVVIVVAPRITVAGRVLDAMGKPIEGASVWTSVDERTRAGLGQILDTSSGASRETKTDASGRFELGDLPACPGLMTVRATGHSLDSISMPDHTTLDLTIVLEGPEKPHAIVRGVVLEPNGRPAEGALVSHGAAIETTGPDGRFEFDLALAIGGEETLPNKDGVLPRVDFSKIHALKKGFAPAREELPDRAALRELGKPLELTLVLGAEPLTIRGRVVDARGKGVSGALVWIKDGTPFGSYIQKEGDMMMAHSTTVEDAFRGKMNTPEVIADADGRFEIEGVLDREYVLVALDPRKMCFGRRERVRASGATLEIAIPDDPSTQRVAGRVISHGGRAIAGVMVRLGRKSDPDSLTKWQLTRLTDEEGRFDFGEVSTDGVHFQMTSKEIAFVFDYEVPRDSEFDELEVPVSLQCHLQVDLGERRDFAEQFAVHDAKGNELTMLCWRGSGATVEQRSMILDGRSAVLAVEEIGREIVFYKADAEVARIALSLKPGELTTVRP